MVQLYPWFNFFLPLLLCMVKYGNEYGTMEINIEHQQCDIFCKV